MNLIRKAVFRDVKVVIVDMDMNMLNILVEYDFIARECRDGGCP